MKIKILQTHSFALKVEGHKMLLLVLTMILGVKSYATATKVPIQENIIVSGVVKDEEGPIQGVSVFFKTNSTIGVVTDENGKYTLEVPANAILVYSLVGYEKLEENVKGRKNVNVVLKSEASEIEEVVITGFGQATKRSDMIGSVTTVKP